MIHTLTRELRLYTIASVVLAGGSSLMLASHVQVRWLGRRGLSTIGTHALLLGTVTLAGLATLGPDVFVAPAPSWLPSWGWLWLVVTVGGAVTVAAVSTGADRRIARVGRARARARTRVASPPTRGTTTRTRAVGLAAGSGTRAITPERDNSSWRPTRADADARFALPLLLVVAVLEECVFRGVLLRAALLVPGRGLRLGSICAAVLAFACAHVYFGWSQVAAKLPLSIGSTVLAMVTGSVIGPALGHIGFNLAVWREQLSTPRPAEPTELAGATHA